MQVDDVLEWLKGRKAHCDRMAKLKAGGDAEWLKDAAYFVAAAKLIANAYPPQQADTLARELADPLVTAYDNGVDHVTGVFRPLALAAEGVINWCDFAFAHKSEFDSHGVSNLDGPAFDTLRETFEAVKAAGLLDDDRAGTEG